MPDRTLRATNRVDAPLTEIESDGFKRMFATLFVANNFDFSETISKIRANETALREYKPTRIGMLADPDIARYIREELAKRRDQYFFTAEDVAAGMYAIAADPDNTPEQRFPYYKVLAEATGLIGKGKRAAEDTAPASGVVIQVANYGSPDDSGLPASTFIDQPKLAKQIEGETVITSARATGKRLTPTAAELDKKALSPEALAPLAAPKP